MIADIVAVNPNVAVVLQANQPVQTPWLAGSRALLDTFYGGDQAGVAAAQLLLGKANPSGHLPLTWPADVSQKLAHQAAHPERSQFGVHADGTPCTANGADCTTTYPEGINVGYRFFEATGETPLFPFGYGLSYTSFTFSHLKAKVAKDGSVKVSVRVTNTGRVAGTAVPQVYLGAPTAPPAGVSFSSKVLVGFDRVTLRPGQSKTVTMVVPHRQLQYWSEASGWVTATGERPLYLSVNARSTKLTTTIKVKS